MLLSSIFFIAASPRRANTVSAKLYNKNFRCGHCPRQCGTRCRNVRRCCFYGYNWTSLIHKIRWQNATFFSEEWRVNSEEVRSRTAKPFRKNYIINYDRNFCVSKNFTCAEGANITRLIKRTKRRSPAEHHLRQRRKHHCESVRSTLSPISDRLCGRFFLILYSKRFDSIIF